MIWTGRVTIAATKDLSRTHPPRNHQRMHLQAHFLTPALQPLHVAPAGGQAAKVRLAALMVKVAAALVVVTRMMCAGVVEASSAAMEFVELARVRMGVL